MKRLFHRAPERVALLAAAAVVSLMVGVPWMSRAQTTPAKETSDDTYTLHVYTDLLQVPTVVLNSLHGSYRSLKPSNFTLTIDNGPGFHPTDMRMQGDDPMTFAILFDFSTDADAMFSALAQALSGLPRGVLSGRDYVSIYAYDCQLQRVTQDKMATTDEMKTSMQRLMTEGRQDARMGATQPCLTRKRLYDVVTRVAQDLGPLPGRRVILVVSDGEDRGSVNDWLKVARYVGNQSITIFGLRPLGTGPAFTHSSYRLHNRFFTVEEEDPFGRLCGSTGGLVLNGDGSRKDLIGQLERMVKILRGRYILEFPRPVNGTPGYYALRVSVTDPSAIVRPSGVAFPPRERDAKAAPGTVPQDTSHMPVVGSRSRNATDHRN